MLHFAIMAACLATQVQAAPADEQLTQKVRELIVQLDGPLAERKKAEKDLIALGPPALDVLEEALKKVDATVSESLQVRLQLDHVRHELQMQSARAAGKATQVTLEAKQMPLAEFLAALEKQTGNAVVDDRRDESKPLAIDAQLADAPFWEALDSALDSADLEINPYAARTDERSADALAIIERSPGMRPRRERAAYAGPFRVEAVSLRSQRDLRYRDVDGLQLVLQICWEPRLRPIEISLDGKSLQATTDLGDAAAVSSRNARFGGTTAGDAKSIDLEIPLVLPKREAKSLKSVKATLDVLVPGRIEAFRFENLTAGATEEQKRGDATVILDHVGRNNRLWQVGVRVFYDQPKGALQSHFGWIYENRADLLDPKGKKIDDVSFESDRVERGVASSYYYQTGDDLTGHVFVYHTPSVLLRLPLEFELSDLPLP